jgi:pimeloyl-ACP methyl ester carboxylesterase
MSKLAMRPMWSKSYCVSDAEVRTLLGGLKRHDGAFYLAAAAGFVADHKKQGERLDFRDVFHTYRHQFPFLVGGSEEDPFEYRQVALAEKLMPGGGLQIARLRGGHLTTSEQPEALAALITRFEKSVSKSLAR